MPFRKTIATGLIAALPGIFAARARSAAAQAADTEFTESGNPAYYDEMVKAKLNEEGAHHITPVSPKNAPGLYAQTDAMRERMRTLLPGLRYPRVRHFSVDVLDGESDFAAYPLPAATAIVTTDAGRRLPERTQTYDRAHEYVHALAETNARAFETGNVTLSAPLNAALAESDKAVNAHFKRLKHWLDKQRYLGANEKAGYFIRLSAAQEKEIFADQIAAAITCDTEAMHGNRKHKDDARSQFAEMDVTLRESEKDILSDRHLDLKKLTKAQKRDLLRESLQNAAPYMDHPTVRERERILKKIHLKSIPGCDADRSR
jgi:hypothetical protein